MDIQKLQTIFEDLDVGTIAFAEPLTRHTTWKIGGPADVFVVPDNQQHIQTLLQTCHSHQIPWYVIGRGSNLLVRDGGIRGLVIKLADNYSDFTISEDHFITAQSGRSFVSLANNAIRNSLTGLEFATGIPGTVGGAVMMNAGAHGGETCNVLVRADVIEADGTLRTYYHEDFQFAYRYSILKDRPGIVANATFRLQSGDRDEMQEQVREWTRRRQRTQPLQLPNCGSVFRNPEGNHAGSLIEQSGLKGHRIGGAQISELHGNFIINSVNAKATDVLALIDLIRRTIQEKCGIMLIPEVRIVGEDC